MRINYSGKLSINNMFKCEMCSSTDRDKYIATPEMPKLVHWYEMEICKKCARREIGSKNNKEWERIHER